MNFQEKRNRVGPEIQGPANDTNGESRILGGIYRQKWRRFAETTELELALVAEQLARCLRIRYGIDSHDILPNYENFQVPSVFMLQEPKVEEKLISINCLHANCDRKNEFYL